MMILRGFTVKQKEGDTKTEGWRGTKECSEVGVKHLVSEAGV